MKAQKTNTIQLIIAGFVVVLVAICGTFAWFASSDRSWVNGIGVTVVSPTTEEAVNSGITQIQIYDPDQSNWKDYDGEIPLVFVPGQSYNFKVIFNADVSQHTWLRLTGFEEPAEGTPSLVSALQYSVKFTKDGADSYQDFKIDHKEENEPYVEFVSKKPVTEFTEKENGMYVLYYTLMLPNKKGEEEVDNRYFNQSFTADVELIFQ